MVTVREIVLAQLDYSWIKILVNHALLIATLVNLNKFAANVSMVFNLKRLIYMENQHLSAPKSAVMVKDLNLIVMMETIEMEMDATKTVKLKKDGHAKGGLVLELLLASNLFQIDPSLIQLEPLICLVELFKEFVFLIFLNL